MNWILKNKGVAVNYGGDSFPLAFRTAFNMIRTAREAGKDASVLVRDLTITAPPSTRGDRSVMTYAVAVQKAKDQGLLTTDGQINSREFKVKR